MKTSKEIVEGYLYKNDWRVKENSNSPFSFGGLNKYLTSEVSKDYWLREVYNDRVATAYVNNFLHIHDLGGLSLYCCGYSLKEILLKGVKGVPNIPTSAPAKHFDSVLNQIANLLTVYQNEIMGAVALNNFDTLLAPYVKIDNLNYKQVKQQIQNFVFSINSNSRGGAEPSFTNLTCDLTPDDEMIKTYVIHNGKINLNITYKDCQEQMDMINKAFYEIMLDGDSSGRPFSYPILTYNINKRFDWDNPNNELLWEMTGKYGYPYFANFVNSDMEPSDVRSMCCRLRLDLTELRRRNGGLFGSGDSTGSIGVVTVNLPKLAYIASHSIQPQAIGIQKTNEEIFFELLKDTLDIAKDSLVIKRKWLQENVIETNLIPAFMEYVGTIDNHFSTIGVIGMNEMCLNLFGLEIQEPASKELCEKVEQFILDTLVEYQVETGDLFNMEATPAEATCYRLAKKDKEQYPDIITQGNMRDGVYYTNSCHIPVKDIESIYKTYNHQDSLQSMFTGGTVIHNYFEGAISGTQAKSIIKTICETYKAPYTSISPIIRYCDEHGYIKDIVDNCPVCGKEVGKFQRITGYLRNIENFNQGKASEFKDRNQYNEKDTI